MTPRSVRKLSGENRLRFGDYKTISTADPQSSKRNNAHGPLLKHTTFLWIYGNYLDSRKKIYLKCLSKYPITEKETVYLFCDNTGISPLPFPLISKISANEDEWQPLPYLGQTIKMGLERVAIRIGKEGGYCFGFFFFRQDAPCRKECQTK